MKIARAKQNKDRDTNLDKFDKVSKFNLKEPLANNLMEKVMCPSNISDLGIVTVYRDVERSTTSSLIGMSLIVSFGPKQTITQDNTRLGKQKHSLALTPRERYLS